MPAQPGRRRRRPPTLLARLTAHALDVHWAWNHTGDALWRRLDPILWERTRNPWLLLQYLDPARLDTLADDPECLQALDVLDEARRVYREAPPWRPAGRTTLPRVAYFSMEFGLHEALPLYAGGLGVLAGDHLKTASDLGIPVTGVGILWQQGYFRQVLDADGRQTELYPSNDPVSLPIRPVLARDGHRLRIRLDLPGRQILLRAWDVVVGRTHLYLLDSNEPLNGPADRGLTSALYGGGPEARLMQAIVLGVGGWRLLEAVGANPAVCHLNEGHAALVILERARVWMQAHHVAFEEALWATRAGNVFTTHTPVPAGFDAFSTGEVERHRSYFDGYVRQLGLSWPTLLALGRQHPDADEPFNMAWLAVRGCGWVNGVSALHGTVSRQLFGGLFPRWPEAEVPVGHITNGVHVPSWDSPWTDALWTRAAGQSRWRGDVHALSAPMAEMRDRDLWAVRCEERCDLVRYVRERLTSQVHRQGQPAMAAIVANDVLQPEALTLGLARRFTAYKRPNLLLHDPDRLARLLTRPGQPVQIVVAGKAHPRDEEGKALVQRWVAFAARPDVRRHVVFLADYDMRMASELVQGVDVWINTPRRPWEASGTSGMKVLVNGGLNLSVADGWWAEACNPDCGWTLSDAGDEETAEALYALLESAIVPEFYRRDRDGLPTQWIRRMRASLARLTPRFSSARMLQEYVERAYVPAASRLRARSTNGARLARELAGWWRRLSRHWHEVQIVAGEAPPDATGGRVTARVRLGSLAAEAVRVELYADAVPGQTDPGIVPMTRGAAVAPGEWIYHADLPAGRPAWHFTPRVVPWHPAALVPLEAPFIAWPD